MYLANKTTMITGILAILLGIGLMVSLASTVSTGDSDPFNRSETADYLKDIDDNETPIIVGAAAGIVVDGFMGIALAAALYVIFRDRSRLLATMVLAGLLVQSAVSLLVDGNNILLTFVAKDFVSGGPAGVAAGDASSLEVGRYLGMFSLAFTNVVFTALGVGLMALGLLIAQAPAGAINPPRWMGWVAFFAGACAELAWIVVGFDPAFVFFPLNFLASLILLFSLGIWLLMHQDLQPAA